MPSCSVQGCERRYYAKSWCALHYDRNLRHGSPDGGSRNHADPKERFWRGVERGAVDECWPYVRGARRGRYGLFQPGGKGSPHVGAHRYSYEMHYGPIPDGRFVMHSCDNPRCVNPAHLSAGTPKDNTADMLAKGRHARQAPLGEASGKAKLTDEAVRTIRRSQASHVCLAAQLGVSPKAIQAVRAGRTWKHVT